MANERKATVTLMEREIQWFEQAVLDRDRESALEFLREVVKPHVADVLNRPGCKPVFEWGTDMDFRPTGPPDGHEGQRAK